MTATRPRTGGSFEVRGLRKAFGDRVAVGGVDVRAGPGEMVVILGANGSGKSTVLRCAVGLLEPDGGAVRLCGREIAGLRGRELAAARRDAALIFQRIQLVGRRSVIDNVCAGALGRLSLGRSLVTGLFPRDLREEAMLCLWRVGLADRAADRASELSGGQQQRAAIARALCQRASVILADEPVSALDPAAAAQVIDLLGALAHDDGLAVLAVLHQPGLARRCADRLVGMVDGKVVFDRKPYQVTVDEIDALYAGEREAAAEGEDPALKPAIAVAEATDPELAIESPSIAPKTKGARNGV